MTLLIIQETMPWAGTRWLEIMVRIVLAILSLLIVLIAISKYSKFRSSIKANRTYLPLVAEAIKNGRIDDAISLSDEKSGQSHLACIVYVGLQEYQRKEKLSDDLRFGLMQQSTERMINVRHSENKSSLGFLDAVGATAPFIGALGGSAFTLAFGIILAAPTIWFATYIRGKSEQFEIEMKNSANELISYLQVQKTIKT